MTRSLHRLPTAFALAGALLALRGAPAFADPAVGAPAPDFHLTGIDGKAYDLATLRGKVVVLEWLNPNCPFSRRHMEQKTMIDAAARHPEVVWLGINSSSPKSRDYLDPKAHTAIDTKLGIAYPVLLDPNGEVGHAYGARTTPHMFVIDEQGKLLYDGAIDDDPSGRKDKTARVNYIDKTLAAHAAGRAVDPATTQSYGCSVKY